MKAASSARRSTPVLAISVGGEPARGHQTGSEVTRRTFFTMAALFLAFGPAEAAGPSAVTAERRAPWSSPAWEQVEERLGGITPTGLPRLAYPLSESIDARRLGLRCQLEHDVDIDARGRPRSWWRIAALRTFLVPEGRDKLLWQPPGAAVVRFDRARIGRAHAEAGPPHWLIRRCAKNEYEIRSRDGRTWVYRRGSLISLTHPVLGSFTVRVDGGAVREIKSDDAPTASPVLRADYDDAGNCLRLAIGGDDMQVFEWDTRGRLISWQRPVAGTTVFDYRDGLLSEMAEEGHPPRRYTWAENPGWRRGDSKWLKPVHLASDGDSHYTYALTQRGILIERLETSTGRRIVTIFNPRRNRLEQRLDEGAVLVTFREGPASRGAFERIETDQGEILEDYRYDDQGNLVGVRRIGEPELELSYDESGRLMALVKKDVP